MNWTDYQRAALYQLLTRLRHREKLHLEVLEWCKKYGYGPDSMVFWNANRSLTQVREYMEDVLATIRHLPQPYRPLANPVKNHGLNSHLKIDFRVRGIDPRR